ncbi:MAG: nitroreductase [Firmicutes bacterium]|nr:nitroreductase [Bacillota bacterium]
MNAVLDNIRTRRSIKKYKPEQIKKDDLDAILEAGTYAPTGRNLQSPIIVAVQDKETIKKLSKMNAKILENEKIDPFYGAPTVLVVLADKNINTYIEDGSLVMENLMLAAHSLGLGSCWIHRAREEFESEEGKALLKKWGVSGNYAGIGHCVLGYADMEPIEKPRKDGYIIIV